MGYPVCGLRTESIVGGFPHRLGSLVAHDAAAAWHVNHPRTASSTIRNVAASTWWPIRSHCPFFSTSSSAEAVLPVSAGEVSSSANRIGALFRSRFLQ